MQCGHKTGRLKTAPVSKPMTLPNPPNRPWVFSKIPWRLNSANWPHSQKISCEAKLLTRDEAQRMRPILAKPLFRVDLPQYCVVCRFRGWHAKVEHHPPSQPGLLSMVGSSDTFADNLRPSHIALPSHAADVWRTASQRGSSCLIDLTRVISGPTGFLRSNSMGWSTNSH